MPGCSRVITCQPRLLQLHLQAAAGVSLLHSWLSLPQMNAGGSSYRQGAAPKPDALA